MPTPLNEDGAQKDMLNRLQRWLDILEARLLELLQANEPEMLNPAERERSISRHLMMFQRFLQLRQKYAPAISPSPGSVEEKNLNNLLENAKDSSQDAEKAE